MLAQHAYRKAPLHTPLLASPGSLLSEAGAIAASLPPLLLFPCCSNSNTATPAKKSKRSSLQAIREGAVVRTYVQQQRNLINQPARFLASHRVSEQGMGWDWAGERCTQHDLSRPYTVEGPSFCAPCVPQRSGLKPVGRSQLCHYLSDLFLLLPLWLPLSIPPCTLAAGLLPVAAAAAGRPGRPWQCGKRCAVQNNCSTLAWRIHSNIPCLALQQTCLQAASALGTGFVQAGVLCACGEDTGSLYLLRLLLHVPCAMQGVALGVTFWAALATCSCQS